MVFRLLVLAVAALGSIGCAQPVAGPVSLPKKAPGLTTELVSVAGMERSFLLRVPKAYDATRPLPLVVLLHGWGGNGTSIMRSSGFGEKAEQEGFILAVPQGLGQNPGWNVGFLDLSGRNQDEVAFVSAVLDKASREVGVDPRRIFVAGHSNGAMLAHLVGSKLSARVAAIGAVAGTIGVPRADGSGVRQIPDPSGSVSVMMIHGKLDPAVAYAKTSTSLLKGIALADAAKWWAQKLGIKTQPKVVRQGEGRVSVETFTGGKDGSEVVAVTFEEGRHEWPSRATEMLWDFFKAHPKNH